MINRCIYLDPQQIQPRITSTSGLNPFFTFSRPFEMVTRRVSEDYVAKKNDATQTQSKYQYTTSYGSHRKSKMVPTETKNEMAA